MPDFLLELRSEEIPARMQARAAEDLERLVTAALREAGLAFSRIEAQVTPRRLALVVEGLPLAQADLAEERKGPRADAPQAAIDGFLRSTGLTLAQCERRETPKGAVWFAIIRRAGRPTAELLAALITRIIAELPWPKSMYWGEATTRWVRPLHGVLALFDGQVLPGALDLGGGQALPFTDRTVGHRFLAPEAFAVTGWEQYRKALSVARVVLNRADRRNAIANGAAALATAAGLRLRDDPGLLEEVTGLVEWPVPLMGRIDHSFMDVPAEVLTTAMRTHQRYFSCLNPDGSLAARFITIANTETRDGGGAVVLGNERVLRARLSDARFFWDLDRRTQLEERLPALADITFHAKLGTLAQKVERIVALVGTIAPAIPGAEPAAVARAARLAKADLVSGMVGEFPELQGVMGRYYALNDGEPAEVAEAVAAHYSPLGPNDACPTAPVSVAVALADKLDTLVGFFAIDEKPTGSRDPFALRRAALGIIRLVLENGLRLKLNGAVAEAVRPIALAQGLRTLHVGALQAELLAFFADRLKVALREQGVRHDLIDAVFALGGEDDLHRLVARVRALAAFLDSEDGANLLIAFRRAANIVRIELKKDKVEGFGAVDPATLREAEEDVLFAALEEARLALDTALADEDFAGAMAVLAGLRQPVDAFFDRVTVNAAEPRLRANRLALLTAIEATMRKVADFAKVEG